MLNIFLIEFNLSLLFSFFIGLGIGLSLAVLFYLILVLSSVRKNNIVVKSTQNNLTDEEVKLMIHEAQQIFKDKSLKGANSNLAYCKELSYELILNIAKKYYPDSKRPLYELSIDEVLMLTVYISNRLDEILDARGLRLFRKLKVSQIIGMTEIKEKIEANSIVKATKKYKVLEAISAAKKVVNIVNPVYWARKAVIDKSLNFAIKKLCLIIIATCGEETYKIYSKAVFDTVVDIDSGIDKLVSDIQSDLSEQLKDDNLKVVESKDEYSQINNRILLEEPKNDKLKKKKSIFSIFKKDKE